MLLPATSMQLFWSYFTIENMSVNRRKERLRRVSFTNSASDLCIFYTKQRPQEAKKGFFSVKTASLFFFIEKKEASFVEGLDVPFWYYLIVVQDEGGVH